MRKRGRGGVDGCFGEVGGKESDRGEERPRLHDEI